MSKEPVEISGPLAIFNPWSAAADPFMSTGMKLTDTVCTRAFDVASELTNFTLLRMQEDVRLPERLSRCRSPQEIQQTWVDFWKKAFEQYQEEWSRLAGMGRENLRLPFPSPTHEDSKRRLAA